MKLIQDKNILEVKNLYVKTKDAKKKIPKSAAPFAMKIII